MEGWIFFLYFGLVVVAFLIYVQFKTAKIVYLQFFVPATLVGAYILFGYVYEEVQTSVLPDDNAGLVLLLCLLPPFSVTLLMLIGYFFLTFQPLPQRNLWLGFATLSLQVLIVSPFLPLLLPRITFDQYGMVGWLYGGVICFMMAVTAGLSRQPPSKIKQYCVLGFGVGILSISLWAWSAHYQISLVGDVSFPFFFSIPYGVVGLFMLLDLWHFSREQLSSGVAAVVISFVFVGRLTSAILPLAIFVIASTNGNLRLWWKGCTGMNWTVRVIL